ncbi:hypothetical protein F4801DRAFT_295669 [Xylaria longipes]|nr:hypothetical protein F4801DRAFT_295669 [Xylaria longipes]
MKALLLIVAVFALLSGIPTAAGDSEPNDDSGDHLGAVRVASPPGVPHIPGPIPVRNVVCTGSKIDRNDMNTAYNKAFAYFNHSAMPSDSVRLFQYQTSMFAVCNCKTDWVVGCPQKEILHADALITAQCGEGYSGRVVRF